MPVPTIARAQKYLNGLANYEQLDSVPVRWTRSELKKELPRQIRTVAFQMVLLIAAFALSCRDALALMDEAFIKEGEVWIKISGAPNPVQLTKDGIKKSSAAISPNKQMVMYCVNSDEHKNVNTEVCLENEQGKMVLKFRPLAHNGYCNSIISIDWIDDRRIGIECHCNPSMSQYLDVDSSTGKTTNEYFGYRFSWSPDHKTLAHVGQMMHFADWPHSEYIQFNNRNIYPKSGAVYGNDKIPVHTFVSNLVWSPDGHKVAVIDDLSGSEEGKKLVVILNGRVTPRFVMPLSGTGEFTLSWKDNYQVVASCESGSTTFDLRTIH